MPEQNSEAAGAYTPVAAVFLLGLFGGALVNVFYPFPIWPASWIRLVGALPLVLGVWIFASAQAAFRRHRTALMPWTASSNLVQDGPFRFSRNPVYLSFLLMYLSFALFLDSGYVVLMLAAVLVLFDRFQIPREEKYLEKTFPVEFDAYRRRVRRWL